MQIYLNNDAIVSPVKNKYEKIQAMWTEDQMCNAMYFWSWWVLDTMDTVTWL
jgi:hypothetical protein